MDKENIAENVEKKIDADMEKNTPIKAKKQPQQKWFILAMILLIAAGTAFVFQNTVKSVLLTTGIYASAAIDKSELDGVVNFREVELDGKIRDNVLYRSSRLGDATKQDIKDISEIMGEDSLIIDLRSEDETKPSADKEIPGAQNKSFKITSVHSADGYVRAYVKNADDREKFANALRAVGETKGSVLIHCSFGKDRTGWMVSMLLYISGATDDEVMTEYLRSNGKIIATKVDEKWLNAALNAARDEYGSIDGYISNGLGLSDEEVQQIREKVSVNQ